MNAKVMFEVLMSVLFFAPLVMAFGFFLLVGVLAAFEGLVAFAAKYRGELRVAEAAVPGPVVAGLVKAVEAEAQDAKVEKEARSGSL